MLGTLIRPGARRLLPALPLLVGLATGCDTPHYRSDWGLAAAPAPAPAQGRPLPEGTFDGVPRSLLNEYQGRDLVARDEAQTWELPFKAKRIIVALLIMAAHDNWQDIDMVFTRGARWGFPDRRELDAWSIFDGDGGARFVEVFRKVAARFGDKASFTCPPMINAAQGYVRVGAEPMWCFYISKDQLDVLAFKLLVEEGAARIDYVGMFIDRPTGPVSVRSQRDDPSPPMVPPAKRRAPGDMSGIRLAPSGLPEGIAAPEGLGAPPPGVLPGAPPAGAPTEAAPAGSPPAGGAPAGAPPAPAGAAAAPAGSPPG